MIVSTKISMDLVKQKYRPRVDVVQGDENTRAVAVSLFADGAAWPVPEDAKVRIRYRKSDGTGGVYDTLPDGSRAWQTEGNTVTIFLEPQMMTIPDTVFAQLELTREEERIATFQFQLYVQRDPSIGVVKSEDYVNMRGWLMGELDSAVEAAAESGKFTPELRVGTVTSLPYGSDASASIYSVGKESVLELGIPRGVDVEPQAPLFANAIDECTDTAKLYVLPDGYLYAYMKPSSAKGYTNWLKSVGYESGLLSSAGANSDSSSFVRTAGYIPCKTGDVIRFQNVLMNPNHSENNNIRIAFYDSGNTLVRLINANMLGGSAASAAYYSPVLDDAGNIVAFTIPSADNTTNLTGVACMRFCTVTGGIDDTSVVTVNEEIVGSTEATYSWSNTGHPFVSADCDDRILTLESQASGLEERVAVLEDTVDSDNEIPSYVREEAESVALAVQDIRTGKSLTFAALADVHFCTTSTSEAQENTKASLKMAGQGITALRDLMSLDAVVVLGDLTASDGQYLAKTVKNDWTAVTWALAEGTRGLASAWVPGSHEILCDEERDRAMTENEIYAYVGGNSVGLIRDPDYPEKNYGYIDFPDQRIRMICLNTADAITEYPPEAGVTAESEWIGHTQLQWLADVALDFSDKADAAKWGIVFCSHHPLRYGGTNKIGRALQLIEAYRDGKSGSIQYTSDGVHTVSYDFTKGDRAEIICNIHGHFHNFASKKMSSSDAVEKWLWRVCIPCINVGLENEHATNADLAEEYGEFNGKGDPVYYRKTPGTREGTSFCIVTIDRESRTIYARAFGTGKDRAIGY